MVQAAPGNGAAFARSIWTTNMLINADFSKPAVVSASDHQWVPSPQGGVERVMLDRIGAEKARATSLVKYAPGSQFPSHFHPCGEEILVLQGTFSEEGGDYPAGWYLRSPHNSSHQPSSAEGTLIFVKLRQMSEAPQALLRLNTGDASLWQAGAGYEMCPLYADENETVALYRMGAGAAAPVSISDGVEVLVIAGDIELDGASLQQHSWIRLPHGSAASLRAGRMGATIYVKSGHLVQDIQS